MRERVEDLGKISVLLDAILDHEIWDNRASIACRNKDFAEVFKTLDEETQEEFLHNLVYQLEELRDKIHECREIAYGEEDN